MSYLRAGSSSGLVPDLQKTARVFETTCKIYMKYVESYGC